MSSEGPARPAMAVGGDEFRRACGRFATGVAIASVMDSHGTPHGLTVSSFTSVSLEPPLILICIGHAVTSIDIFRAASHFGINVLSAEQRPIADLFARKGQDRFNGLSWHCGETGVPLLSGVLAEIECSVNGRIPAGDHDIFIGEMVRGRNHKGEPLIYYASKYRHLAEC